jgi:mRNA-degrading endonuclease HigB of HigAB toxin-antitoxin module
MKHLQIFKFFEAFNKSDYYKEIGPDQKTTHFSGTESMRDWQEEEIRQICNKLINLINEINRDEAIKISEISLDISDIWKKGGVGKFSVLSWQRNLLQKKDYYPSIKPDHVSRVANNMTGVTFNQDLLKYFSEYSIQEIILKIDMSKFSNEISNKNYKFPGTVKKLFEEIRILKLEDEWFFVIHHEKIDLGNIIDYDKKIIKTGGTSNRKYYECDQLSGLLEFFKNLFVKK